MNFTELINNIVNELNSQHFSEIVQHYQEIIEDLDDCVFVQVVETLPDYGVNLKEFDNLLHKESPTQEEIDKTIYWINLTKKLICSFVRNKIIELERLLERI